MYCIIKNAAEGHTVHYSGSGNSKQAAPSDSQPAFLSPGTHDPEPPDLVLQAVESAIDQIAKNPLKPISAESIAMHERVNRVELSRRFRAVTGMGIKEYIDHKRLELAAQMLAGGRHTVKQVALKYGYAPSYFARVFRMKYKMTPKEWQMDTGKDNKPPIKQNEK